MKNVRNYTQQITLKSGELITLGYDNDVEHEGDEKCIWVGEFKDGDLFNCCVGNTIATEHVLKFNKGNNIVGELTRGFRFYKSQQWWRKATDEEVKKYYQLLNKSDIKPTNEYFLYLTD